MALSPAMRANLTMAEDVLLAALRRKRLVLGTYLVVVAVGLAAWAFSTPTYRAAGKLLLTSNRVNISTSPNQATELQRSNLMSEPELRSQIEVLRSRELIDAALQTLAPPPPDVAAAAPPEPLATLRALYHRLRGPAQDASPTLERDLAVRKILDALDVANIPKSTVIEVGFTDPDPARARDFVNTLLDAYIDRYAELQQISEAENFFTRQSELLRTKLAHSESALREARDRAGLLAGQEAEVHARLNEFSADLARVRIARVEQDERVRYLESLRSRGDHSRVASPALMDLEAKRAEMVGRYRPDSERMQALDAQIAQLKGALSRYDGVTGGPGTTDPALDLIAARASLAALRGKEQALEKERAAYQAQAEFLDTQNFDLTRLERQVKLDEEAYLSYVKTAEESRLSNALEQSKLLRLRIIERAGLPLAPVNTTGARLLLLALLGGLVAAVGVGALADQLDPRVKNAAEVVRATGLDVLVSIPPRG